MWYKSIQIFWVYLERNKVGTFSYLCQAISLFFQCIEERKINKKCLNCFFHFYHSYERTSTIGRTIIKFLVKSNRNITTFSLTKFRWNYSWTTQGHFTPHADRCEIYVVFYTLKPLHVRRAQSKPRSFGSCARLWR